MGRFLLLASGAVVRVFGAVLLVRGGCVYIHPEERKKGILVFVKRDWGQYCYGVGGSKECFRYCVLYVVVCTTWYINPEIVLVSYAYSTTCSPPRV